MLFWLYSIENKINGKKYFGKAKMPKKRWACHLSSVKNNSGYYIHSAMRKYGVDNFWFRCIGFFFTEEEALKAEKEVILFNKTYDNKYGYNLTLGGEGSSGFKHSEETKLKLKELAKKRGKNIGELNHFYGKKHSNEVKQILSNKRKKISDENAYKIISDFCNGESINDLSKKNGLSNSSINEIINGKTYKNLKRDFDLIKIAKENNKKIKAARNINRK